MQDISFKNYSASYQNSKIDVLSNISLDIKKGKMIAIIGKSGSGKTTLFNALLKQLKITSGSLLINQKDINSIKKREWKKIISKVGYLSQETNLIPHLNVYENILHFYPKYKNKFFAFFKILTKNQKNELHTILDNLGILNKIYTRVSDLSGGQKQRVEIAKLLLKNVDIILADEPTSSLDIKTSKDIMNILKKINQEYQTTILVNLHDLNIIQSFFDSYCFIKDGKLLKKGNPKNLTKQEIESLYES